METHNLCICRDTLMHIFYLKLHLKPEYNSKYYSAAFFNKVCKVRLLKHAIHVKRPKTPIGLIWSEMSLESGEHPCPNFSFSEIAINLCKQRLSFINTTFIYTVRVFPGRVPKILQVSL